MIKKFISISLVCVIALSLLWATPVSADTVTTPNGIVFDKNTGTITDYIGNESTLVIPAEIDGVSVVIIGSRAFEDCTGLINITIPIGVTSIGWFTFSGCTELTSITIPNSVSSFGICAFYHCTGLTSITIPNSMSIIGSRAFEGCTGLTSIIIPNSVTSIAEGAFNHCSSLTSITIPDSVTSIGNYAFAVCSSLTSVIIPSSVTSIDGCAFYDCRNLSSITIPNGVISIGSFAFAYCWKLLSITIPSSVTSIGDAAFFSSGLTQILVDENNIHYCSVNGVLFSKDKKHLLLYLPSNYGDYIIPNSVTDICSHAFAKCNGLTHVTIPDSVTSIGDYAFHDCPGLTSMIIPDSISIINDYTFCYCGNLTNIIIPNSVTSIGNYAFYGCRLESAYFYGNAPIMGNCVFNALSLTIFYLTDKTGFTTPTWYGYSTQPCNDGEQTHVSFPLTNKTGNHVYTLNNGFQPSVFDGPSTSYSPYLAEMSVVASAAAYNAIGQPNDSCIKDLLEKFQFTDVETHYDRTLTESDNDYVSYSFGHRKVVCSGNVYNLIAVIIRGTKGYEWISNFDIAESFTDTEHYGFKTAKNYLMMDLDNYRAGLISSGISMNNANTKIWITGHSRGAAVANLVAHELNQSYSSWAIQDNIYAYTFATPNVSKQYDIYYESNIFNFTNNVDFVTKVPLMAGWRFNKYGRTINMNPTSLSSFSSLFGELAEEPYNGFATDSEICGLIKNILSIAPTLYAYYTKPYYPNIYYPNIVPVTTNDLFGKLSLGLSTDSYLMYSLFAANGAEVNLAPVVWFFVWNGGVLKDHIFDAHCPETYISYIKAYNDSNMYENRFTDNFSVSSGDNILTSDVKGDIKVDIPNVNISGSINDNRHIIYGDIYVSEPAAAFSMENLDIQGNVTLLGENFYLDNCTIAGNLSIHGSTSSTVNHYIKNTVVNGETYIDEDLRNGKVTFDGCTINGTATVKAGGQFSIDFVNSQVDKLIVNKNYGLDPELVHIVAWGNTTINNVQVSGSAILENNSIGINDCGISTATLTLSDETNPTVVLCGSLPSITADTGANVHLDNGSSVDQFIINGNASGLNVTGDGSIQTAIISAQVVNAVQIDVPLSITKIINDSADGFMTDFVTDGDIIRGIAPETLRESFDAGIQEPYGYTIRVEKNDGSDLPTGSNVGTGMKFQLLLGTEIVKEYTIIIYGDTTGDGNINVLDLLGVKRHILGFQTLTGAYATAANTDHDTGGAINVLDLLKIKRDILGLETIVQ